MAVELNELKEYVQTQLSRDMTLLHRGARHLAVLGWMCLLPGLLLIFMVMLPMLGRAARGGGAKQAMVFMLLIGILLIVSGLFFLILRNYIQRGRLWAILVSMGIAFVVVLSSGFVIIQELVPGKERIFGGGSSPMISLLYLIGHIHMLIDLGYCLGARDRIATAASIHAEKMDSISVKQPDRFNEFSLKN